MLSGTFQAVVLAFGVAVCALSVWGMLAPDKMMKMVYGAVHQDWGIHLAIVLRLVLGAALLIAAPESRFPLIFEILGWVAIIAAVGLVFMGRERLRKLVAWFDRMPHPMIRICLFGGIVFGAFLVYGIV